MTEPLTGKVAESEYMRVLNEARELEAARDELRRALEAMRIERDDLRRQVEAARTALATIEGAGPKSPGTWFAGGLWRWHSEIAREALAALAPQAGEVGS